MTQLLCTNIQPKEEKHSSFMMSFNLCITIDYCTNSLLYYVSHYLRQVHHPLETWYCTYDCCSTQINSWEDFVIKTKNHLLLAKIHGNWTLIFSRVFNIPTNGITLQTQNIGNILNNYSSIVRILKLKIGIVKPHFFK